MIDIQVAGLILVIAIPVYSMMWKMMVATEEMKGYIREMKKQIDSMSVYIQGCRYCYKAHEVT